MLLHKLLHDFCYVQPPSLTSHTLCLLERLPVASLLLGQPARNLELQHSPACLVITVPLSLPCHLSPISSPLSVHTSAVLVEVTACHCACVYCHCWVSGETVRAPHLIQVDPQSGSMLACQLNVVCFSVLCNFDSAQASWNSRMGKHLKTQGPVEEPRHAPL